MGSFQSERDMIKECGLYIIKDSYFASFNTNGRMMDNKYEKRPYYCGITMSNGIIWMIPTSSQVAKYAASIKKDEEKRGECIFHYIAPIMGKDNVFLIGDAIPCKEEHIKRTFDICGKPFVIEDKADIKEIRHKLSKFLTLVRGGKLHPYVDILSIEKMLTK